MATRLTRSARLTPDIQTIVAGLESFLNGTRDDQGRVVCAAKCGIYAFFDFDDEPIYVGQTYEQLRVRIRRHLTNQRTDAVAMHVLDPLEVARVEVWPFWDFQSATTPAQKDRRKETLDRAEFAIHSMLAARAQVSTMLNEKWPRPTQPIDLPPSFSGEIIPPAVRERIGHADERIARRAATIANLAQVIRERDVSLGLRRTLVTQARRLQLLATSRLSEVEGQTPAAEAEGETRGSGQEED